MQMRAHLRRENSPIQSRDIWRAFCAVRSCQLHILRLHICWCIFVFRVLSCNVRLLNDMQCCQLLWRWLLDSRRVTHTHITSHHLTPHIPDNLINMLHSLTRPAHVRECSGALLFNVFYCACNKQVTTTSPHQMRMHAWHTSGTVRTHIHMRSTQRRQNNVREFLRTRSARSAININRAGMKGAHMGENTLSLIDDVCARWLAD